MDFIYIQYRFNFGAGREISYKLRLDPVTSDAVESTPDAPPPWTALTQNQCSNCPLKPSDKPLCPAALGLSRILERFKGIDAFQTVEVEVSTPERTSVARMPVQKPLTSLTGLIIATSGCPHTSFLRPMARFHLPFATDDETLYRATSMYLLGQYFRQKNGETADFALEGLADRYRQLQIVNNSLGERLKAAFGRGAAAQAIGMLDMFSHNLPFDIRSDLSRISKLFRV